MSVQGKNIQRLILQDVQNSSLLYLDCIRSVLDQHPETTSMMLRFPFLLAIVKEDGNFEYVNGHCLEHFPVNKRNAVDINAYAAYQEVPAFVFSMRQAMKGVVRKEVVPTGHQDLVGWFFPLPGVIDGEAGALVIIFKTRVNQMVTEKDLQFYRSHFAKAQRIGKIGVWEWDLKTDLVYWSSETYRLYGFQDFSFEPNINKGLDFIHPDDRTSVIATINTSLNEGKGYDIEFRVVLKDGEVRYQRVNTELIFNDEDEVIKVFGIVQDITEKKVTENRLESTNKRIVAILENIPNAFVSVNADWTITYANKIMERLLKISRRKMINQNLWDLFPEGTGEACHTFLSDAIAQNSSGVHEVHFDTLQSWFEISVSKGPEGYLVFFNDVTKHKTLENTLRDLNEAKNQFFSIVAHDLKSPFNSIMGLTDLLEKSPDALKPSELQAIMQRLGKNTRNVYKMLENLLLWSRNQMNQLKMEIGTYDLQEIVEFNKELFIPKAEQKGIKITNNLVKPIEFSGDKNVVDTVVRNLLSNAIKFTPKEGEVHWEFDETASEIIVSVTDTGVGMTNETIDTIFKKKGSVSQEGTEGEKGTGLGLQLCQDLVEKSGGKMWVKSSPAGTTFYFSLLKP
ncbi:ATP-binding protein [Roseivirga sp. BDSF3-8]|uniref:PAS domain-containing sensor histidine kinase n=1 Tax=Roseivirga sp. BDSF3-8 TaxID=3241598 RepID=UPI0035327F47